MYVYFVYMCRLLPKLVVLVLVHQVSVPQLEAPPLRVTSTSMMSSFRELMLSVLTTHTPRKMVRTCTNVCVYACMYTTIKN